MLTNMEEAVSNETYIESNHSNKGPVTLVTILPVQKWSNLSKLAPSSSETAQANKWRCVCVAYVPEMMQVLASSE